MPRRLRGKVHMYHLPLVQVLAWGCPQSLVTWRVAESAVSCVLGHFLGNNTVIDVLRQAGLEVEHTPAGQTIHR